jgi:LDH2 family malate/lactate/ureidoglycolate dehydrogenase
MGAAISGIRTNARRATRKRYWSFFWSDEDRCIQTCREFKKHMDKWIRRFRSAKTVEDQPSVIIPGDPEREMEKTRMNNGIPLLKPVIEDLKFLSERFQVDFFES